MTKQNITKFLLDLTAFIGLLIASAPHFTGQSIHEWLAVALSGAIVVHLLLNWNWIVKNTSGLFSKETRPQRFKYILNWAIFASGTMIMLSGFMISKVFIPFLGLSLPQNMSWKELHELSTNVTVILMGLHMAVHWGWIKAMFRRLFPSRSASKGAVSTISMQRKDI